MVEDQYDGFEEEPEDEEEESNLDGHEPEFDDLDDDEIAELGGGLNTIDWLPLDRFGKDLHDAAQQLTREDVRALVDLFYMQQRQRIRINNQLKAARKDKRPFALLEWMVKNQKVFEANALSSLAIWARQYTIVDEWAQNIYGVGPIICAGMLSHLNEKPPPSAGHWWSFAGITPTSRLFTTLKAKNEIANILRADFIDPPSPDTELTTAQLQHVCARLVRRYDTVHRNATTTKAGKSRPLTLGNAATAIATRSWNAKLKTLLWKFANVQVRLYARSPDKCIYGGLYYKRRHYEQQKNLNGEYAEQAGEALRVKNYSHSTDAYKWYSGQYGVKTYREYLKTSQFYADERAKLETSAARRKNSEQRTAALNKVLENGRGKEGSGRNMLPPLHLHARCLRWTSRMFLSHWHWVQYEIVNRRHAPMPWVIEHGGHSQMIPPPGWDGSKYTDP